MALKLTGEICVVHIGETSVDLGNYYIDEETGEKVLVTFKELAQKYYVLVHVPIYVRRPTPLAPDRFQRESAVANPLQSSEIAEVPPATSSGR